MRTSKSAEGRGISFIPQPLCQSGVWRTSGSSNGSYSNLGSHRGSFTGRNTGSGTLFVYASG
ncbi:prepilin, shufflon protein A, partial [Escherichia coli]|nr:prepilin, shufflon protein A [Escherichia coli]